MHFNLVLPLLGLVMNGWGSAIPADVSDSGLSISRSDAGDFVNAVYGHALIEMTPESVKASGIQSWYGNWVQEARANETLYAKYGEVNYFGMTFLQDEDYE